MSQVSSTRKLLSASALMASGTLISRILGMLRVALIAFILGNGTRQADMLGIATMVPNAIYILFAGGALNTVLVPQIVRAIKNDEDGGEAYTNRIMTAFMLVVGVVAVIATIAAPLVTMIYSDSAWRGPDLVEQYASMVALTYLTLPQIFFYGAFFLFAQVLNARDKFGPMMWAPIANNVVSILVLSTYLLVWGNQGDKSVAFSTGQMLTLGIGSTLGIVTQSLVLIPFLKKVGFKFRPRFDLKGTGLGHTFSLTKWTLGFVAVNQLALVVVNRLATSATAGGAGAGVQVYSNAHLLWILPHSLVTTSLATAMLPNASRLAASSNHRGVAEEMTKTVRLALVFIVPATAVFLALASPTANFLFGHGRGSSDADWVGWALMAFAVGLIPFTVQFVCLRTYYAMEDTRTPFLLQIGIAGINALGAILFVWWVDDPTLVATALAASYSLAYFVGVFVSWQLLRRKLPDLNGAAIGMHIVRLLLGAVPGAVAAWLLSGVISGRLGHSIWTDLLSLAVGGILILGCTLGVGRLLKIRELRNLGQLLRRRGAKDSPSAVIPVADDDPPTTIRPRPAVPGQFAEELVIPAAPVQGAAAAEPPPAPLAEPEYSLDDIFRDDDIAADGADEPLHAVDDEPSFAEHHVDEDDEDDEDDDGTADTAIVAREPSIGEAGMVLGVRYELDSLLTLRDGSETWLAHDQVLSRDVVVHVVAAGDPHADRLLNAARRGAAATDSRFLRVLDVDQLVDDGPVGVYVVCEHSAGRTLRELLEAGPLNDQDGAFISRQVADALAPLHAQGLFHEHLDADHVLITAAGGVRIIGFGVAAALLGSDTTTPWSRREADDVIALGAILRSTQSGQWDPSTDPGDGLPMAEVWQAAFDGRIATMAAFADALPEHESSAALEARMALAGRAQDRPDSAPAPVAAKRAAPSQTIDLRAEPRPRTALWVLVVLAMATLLVSLVIVAVTGGQSERQDPVPGSSGSPGTPDSTGTPSGEGEPSTGTLGITDVTDFDPEDDGGNGEEFPELADNVLDGDPATTWTSERYLNRANMGGLKPGVGLVLDLGGEHRVDSVEVTFVGAGETFVELRVPQGTGPSMATVDDWDVVVDNHAAPTGAHTLTPSGELTARYLLLYVTELPPVEGGFRAEISEVVVKGS